MHVESGGERSAEEEGQSLEDRLPTINDCESPLAWLAKRRQRDGRPMLSVAQFEAGERLRVDLWFAELTPRVTANWSRCASGCAARGSGPAVVALHDDVIAARERVRRALKEVGPELSGILIDVCGHLKGLEAVERELGWPQRSAKVILQLALDRLARHYGLAVESKTRQARHWGTVDYRPTLDSWL